MSVSITNCRFGSLDDQDRPDVGDDLERTNEVQPSPLSLGNEKRQLKHGGLLIIHQLVQ